MWLGLSNQYSPRVLRWVDGSEVRTGEEGTRDRAMLLAGKVCVSLDGNGQPSSNSCTAKRAFVCQFTRQGKPHHTLQLQSASVQLVHPRINNKCLDGFSGFYVHLHMHFLLAITFVNMDEE